MSSITSKQAKAFLIKYAIKTWHPLLIIDEVSCNHGFADIFILKPNMESIEIEVKVSLSDLTCNEIKKRKYNERFWTGRSGASWGEHITNFFYFYVPDDIQAKANKYIRENIPFAGLLTGNVQNKRRAKRLHDRKMSDKIFKEFQQVQARKYACSRANELDPPVILDPLRHLTRMRRINK